MNPRVIRIATRNSPLALTQAYHIKTAIEERLTDTTCELVGITSAGDKDLTTSLTNKGGKGLFVKNLQVALREDRADIAVHCVKDMSVQSVEDLSLVAITERADARDVLIAKEGHTLETLPEGAHVGTASPRRTCLLKQLRPDLKISLCRGNVNSRIQKLDDGLFDATVLAAAGLIRLNLSHLISEYLPPQSFIPCIGQGALGIETRSTDVALQKSLQFLNDKNSALCVTAERAVNQVLGGDCHCAIGAYAIVEKNQILLRAFVSNPDTLVFYQAEGVGNLDDAEAVGKGVAEQLLEKGARKCLT